MSVSVADVLDNLISVSAAPSTLGAQLDRLRLGTHSAPDPFRARDDVENHLIQQAALIRCIDQFTARQVLPIPRPAIIEKIQKETHTDQGRIAVSVLRAYHERSTRSQERGMVEVYRLLARMAPETTPPSPTEDSADLAKQLVDLLEDPQRRSSLRAAAAAAVRRYDWSVVAGEIVRVYETVTGR